MTDRQTRLMSALALVFGSVAVLGPAAAVSPVAAAAAVATGVVALVVLRVPDLRVPGSDLLYVLFAPALGAALVAAVAVAPASLLAAGQPPMDYERIAAAGVVGGGGALGVATLLAGVGRGLTADRVRAAWYGVGRVAGAWLLVGAVSYAATTVGLDGGTVAAAMNAVTDFESGGPERVTAAVFVLGAFVPLLAAVAFGAWKEAATSPVGAVPLYRAVYPEGDAPPDESESDGDPEAGGTRVGRLLSRSILLFVGVGLGRPVVVELFEATDAPGTSAVRAFDAAVIAVASSPGVLRGVLVALAFSLFAYVVAVGVQWVRRRIDRDDTAVGPTSATLGVAAVVGAAVHLAAPAYRPAVAARLLESPLPFEVREPLLASLPSVAVGTLFAATAAGFALLSAWLWSGRASRAEAKRWLAHRNQVFVAVAVTVLSAAVYGASPTLLFVATVAGLLAWDFLEYGYGLAAEVGARGVQPPELAHATASVGVGTVLVVGTWGAHEVGGSFAPPTAVSYLAVPVLVVSATLLLLYLTD